LVALNFSAAAQMVPVEPGAGQARVIFSSEARPEQEPLGGGLRLAAFEGWIGEIRPK
jgi:hypothetical protein